MTAPTGVRALLLPPRPDDVVALQAVTTYPCVSVLCTTTPADRLRPDDAARLQQLVRDAGTRLRAELPAEQAQALVDRLQCLVLDAGERPAAHAVALFVGGGVTALHHLPVAVADRVIVDPTFATRDLVRGLQRRPSHLLLVLGADSARLIAAEIGGLRVVGRYDADTAGPDQPAADRERQGRAVPADERRRAFLRRVDKALGAELRKRPRPVVLAGVDRLTSEFTALSRSPDALAGCVPGSHHRTSPQVLSGLAGPILDAHLDKREAEVLDRVERARRAGRTAAGLEAAWVAARRERPDLLAVEEGLAVPARLGGEQQDLVRSDDVEHPEVLDDAVDELVEVVLAGGGGVAFLRDGALQRFGGVVLTLRS